MTTHQAIAMAFPALTTIAVGLFAYGLTRWIGRKRPEDYLVQEFEVAKTVGGIPGVVVPSATVEDVKQALEEADRLIKRSQRQLQPANAGPKAR